VRNQNMTAILEDRMCAFICQVGCRRHRTSTGETCKSKFRLTSSAHGVRSSVFSEVRE